MDVPNIAQDEAKNSYNMTWINIARHLLGFLRGSIGKHMPYFQDIAGSNPDDVTAICDQESKKAKLDMLSEWEGWHYAQTCQSRRICMCKRVVRTFL